MADVRRNSIFVLRLAAGAFLFSGEASAADSTKWLIENPVSMMDWGSEKAKESAQHAADLLNKFMEGRAKQDSDFEYDKTIPEEVKTKTIEDRKRWAKSSHNNMAIIMAQGSPDMIYRATEFSSVSLSFPTAPFIPER
jgi:hypothetical protein